MARFNDKKKALELRMLGYSYSQIKKTLGISKSTLSSWLRDYPLSKQRIKELRDCSEQRIEKYRETRRRQKEERLDFLYKKQKKIILPLMSRELFLAGLFLYWGEGTKMADARISISNTDPSMINFFIKWCKKSLLIPPNKFKVYLHLYRDMNAEKELQYWSKTINIPRSQFINPYIKKSLKSSINHKGAFGHGTCNVSIGDARLAEKIQTSIKVIASHFS